MLFRLSRACLALVWVKKMSSGWIDEIVLGEEEVPSSPGKCFDGDIDFGVEEETTDFPSVHVDREADEDAAASENDISADCRLTISWLEK